MKLICNYLKENTFHKLVFFFLLLGLPLAAHTRPLTSINIIDRNGITETISEKERLKAFQNTDFLKPQPYQKVLRVFSRDKKGDTRSCITSYHPNGQIKQYLESVNSRAFGLYREWHSNGTLKIHSLVIGGMADVSLQAQETWLFDGVSYAYDEEGHLLAEIAYQRGELEGESKYYHPNGKVWKSVVYAKSALHGTERVFLEDGTLFQTTEYQKGMKEGTATRYWSPTQIAFEESYEKGLLMEGSYYSAQGKLLAQVKAGNGYKAIFGKGWVHELQEYQKGEQEGQVSVFDKNGVLLSSYGVKRGEKEGEELSYFPTGKPKLSIHWKEGVMQGMVKTWYEGGTIESQKEMSQNKKNGLFSMWYPNGSLMAVEQYDNDRLLKGEYYKIGEKGAISLVEQGRGVATLFDARGTITKKITYQDGVPLH